MYKLKLGWPGVKSKVKEVQIEEKIIIFKYYKNTPMSVQPLGS